MGAFTRKAKSVAAPALGVVEGLGITVGATHIIRKIPKFNTPGILSDWFAPLLGAGVGVAAGFGTSKVSKKRFVQDMADGAYAGAAGGLVLTYLANLGVKVLRANLGTQGLGIAVSDAHEPLSAVIQRASVDGVALAALDDGTLAEFVVEGVSDITVEGEGVEGVDGSALAALDSMVDKDGDDEDDRSDSADGIEDGGGVTADTGSVGGFAAGFGQGFGGGW